MAIVLGTAAATVFAYDWTQKQYFVASDNGNVVIYRGVDANMPGLSLNSVEETTDIPLEQLPTYSRQRVEAGITATDLDDALRIVSDLQAQVRPPASPEPSPTKKSATPTPTQTATQQ